MSECWTVIECGIPPAVTNDAAGAGRTAGAGRVAGGGGGAAVAGGAGGSVATGTSCPGS